MIVAWSLATNPSDNYLECNGQAVDSKKYPKLYKLMKNAPDYRGVFLRGLGSVTSTHYGTVNHSSSNLNELQGDAIRNITGTFGYLADRHGIYTDGSFYIAEQREGSHRDISGSNWRFGFNASRVVPIANENRPINKAVRYFIKAK